MSRASPFPDPRRAPAHGLLAVGGDLSVPMLLAAYRRGIFPWYGEGEPIQWWSPDPRCILFPDRLRISKSLHRVLRSGRFTITFDRDVPAVIAGCARTPRRGQAGTWITRDMIAAYEELHRAGYAHSVEAWRGEALAGGLYGVALGRVFFGESMFSSAPDASKAALAALVRRLAAKGYRFIDAQNPTPHLLRLGAEPVPRARFLALLAEALDAPSETGAWSVGG
jgi:leucyl/phenylalanyl-tRNA---protein transferase